MKKGDQRVGHRIVCNIITGIVGLLLGFVQPSVAQACPFCSAVKPTLAQRQEAATAAFLGECLGVDSKTKPSGYSFAVRRWLKGESLQGEGGHETVRLPLAEEIKPGALLLLLGTGENGAAWDKLQWQGEPLTEVGFSYVARAPDLRTKPAQRLAYFAKYLEHADSLVAEDAFLEFGHVPYDVVAQAATVLSAEKLRRWIVDAKVPGERKGFYGLALGLTAKGDERTANLALLKRLVKAPTLVGGDFRAGYDGILGGYLVAKGAEAIEVITKRILANPQAAVGDVRHAQRAFRFYFEFGPAADRPAIAAATEHLLDRPSEASEAITDLAGWRHWSALSRVAELYERREKSDVATRRAVVGYLLACPLPQASAALTRLSQRDPEGVTAAEKALQVLGGKN